VDAADTFVRIAASDDEARDLGVDLIIEIGEDIGRELCATSVLPSFGGALLRVAAHHDALLRPSVAVCLLLVAVSRHFLFASASPSNYSVVIVLTLSEARGLCGPVERTEHSAATSCRLHLKLSAARESVSIPSMKRIERGNWSSAQGAVVLACGEAVGLPRRACHGRAKSQLGRARTTDSLTGPRIGYSVRGIETCLVNNIYTVLQH